MVDASTLRRRHVQWRHVPPQNGTSPYRDPSPLCLRATIELAAAMGAFATGSGASRFTRRRRSLSTMVLATCPIESGMPLQVTASAEAQLRARADEHGGTAKARPRERERPRLHLPLTHMWHVHRWYIRFLFGPDRAQLQARPNLFRVGHKPAVSLIVR